MSIRQHRGERRVILGADWIEHTKLLGGFARAVDISRQTVDVAGEVSAETADRCHVVDARLGRGDLLNGNCARRQSIELLAHRFHAGDRRLENIMLLVVLQLSSLFHQVYFALQLRQPDSRFSDEWHWKCSYLCVLLEIVAIFAEDVVERRDHQLTFE